MLEGFQAGLSWAIILRKRDAFRKAFKQFDPKKVARFGESDIARLLNDEGIIRSRAKIEATIGGARAFLAMQAAGEDFSEFVWNLAGGKPIQNRGPVPAQTPLSDRDLQGIEGARVQICRARDCLRVDAGGRDRQRSRLKLLSAGKSSAAYLDLP